MRIRTNIMIIALTLGLLLIPAMTSASGTVLKVIPASIDTSAGEEFSIDVVLDPDGAPVYGVQYELVFDTTSLEFVSQTAGDFLSHDGANTIEILNKFNEESKRIEYGETRMGVETGVTAAGTLAHITFKVIGDRGSCLDFTEVIVAGPMEAGTLPVSIENGVCLVDGIAPTSTPESVHDSTPPENTSGFGTIMAYAGILMVSYVLRRRNI